MADNLDPDVLNQLNQQLRDLTDVISSQSAAMKQGAKDASVFNTALRSSSKPAENMSQVFKKAKSDFDDQMRQYGQIYDKTTKEYVSAKDKEMRLLSESHKAVYDELQAKRANTLKEIQRNKLFSEQLRSLGYSQDANGKLIKTAVELTDAQKQQIKEIKKHDEKVREIQKRYDDFGDTMKNNLGSLVKGLGGFAAGLAKGDASFASLNPIIDLVADALGSVAKLIPVFGDGIAQGIKVGAEAAKLTMQLLDKNLKMFQDISNMGGLISNGMQGLQEQVIASGMSMEGFTKIVKENGTELAAYGGTVGLGADKFMNAVGQLTKKDGPLSKAGMDMRRLGLTADQMGEQMAAYLQQEIRLGRGRNMTEEQLAKGTANYVKELDLLQKATGLSREDVQKQRDQLMSDSRYRAARDKMEAMGQGEGAKALDAFIMNIRDPELKRGVMDLASGAANTEAAGKALVTFGNTIPDIINNLKQSTDPKDAAKRYDEAQNTLQAAAKDASARWRDVMSFGSDAMINYAYQADLASGKFKGSMEEALKIQEQQLKGQDKLTEETIAAQQEMDKMKNKMFDFSNLLMDKAAPAVKAFTEALNAGADFITKTFGAGTEKAQTAPDVSKAGDLGSEAKAIAESGAELTDKQREIYEKALQEYRESVKNGTMAQKYWGKDLDEKMQAAKERMEAAQRGQLDEKQLRKTAPSEGKAAAAGAAQPGTRPAPSAPAGPSAPTRGAGQQGALAPKTDVSSLIKFQGDALGNREHYAALDSGVRENFERMIAEYGKPVQINAAMRDMEEQRKMYENAKPGPDGKRYNEKGNPVAPPGASKHNYGRALDLNSQQVKELDTMGLLAKYGFNTIANDPPHIEMARFGGMFSGPDSGYPVMLHGKEAVIPQQQLESIKSVLEKVTKESLPSNLTPTVAPANKDESVDVLKDLYNIMSEKLDAIVDKLSSGNDTRQELLQYSRV